MTTTRSVWLIATVLIAVGGIALLDRKQASHTKNAHSSIGVSSPDALVGNLDPTLADPAPPPRDSMRSVQPLDAAGIGSPSQAQVPENNDPFGGQEPQKIQIRGGQLSRSDLPTFVIAAAPSAGSMLKVINSEYADLPTDIQAALGSSPSEVITQANRIEGGYSRSIELLLEEVSWLLEQAHDSYYAGSMFNCQLVSTGPLAARDNSKSRFSTKLLLEMGGWYVDAGFASADHPGLELALEALEATSEERNGLIRSVLK